MFLCTVKCSVENVPIRNEKKVHIFVLLLILRCHPIIGENRETLRGFPVISRNISRNISLKYFVLRSPNDQSPGISRHLPRNGVSERSLRRAMLHVWENNNDGYITTDSPLIFCTVLIIYTDEYVGYDHRPAAHIMYTLCTQRILSFKTIPFANYCNFLT